MSNSQDNSHDDLVQNSNQNPIQDSTTNSVQNLPNQKVDNKSQNTDLSIKPTSNSVSDSTSNSVSQKANSETLEIQNLNSKVSELGKLIVFLNIVCLILFLISGFLFVQSSSSFTFFPSFNSPVQTSALENQIKNLINKNFLFEKPTEKAQDIGKLKGLVAALDDPYSEFLTKEDTQKSRDRLNNRYEGIGVQFGVVDGIKIEKVLKNSPAQKSDLRVGDELIKINNELVSEIPLKNLAEKIRGELGTLVKLELKRGGETITKDVPREQIIGELVELEVRGNVGIITISSFGENLGEKMQQIAQKIDSNKEIKSLIIDLRDNGGGLLDETIEVASYFLPDKTLIVQEKSKTRTQKLYSVSKSPSLARLPVKVLINGNSASASEILAASLREDREAVLIGQKSFGKGIVQQIFDLGENQLKLTIEEWLTPSGNQIHKIGLTPDIIVPIKENSLDIALKN